MNDVWANRTEKTTSINPDLYSLYSSNYLKAIDGVFDPKNSASELVRGLKLNVSRLAAAKTFRQCSDLVNLAAGSSTKELFLKDSRLIINKFNRYQSAEYNTITARARTAKQFERFIGESKRFPNLVWLKTRSSTPRELHLGYVGITLPIGHPFWQQNQPGNLWNCKCDWKTTDASVTSEPERIVPPARGLEGNPAQTGELVSEKHPYFKGTPKWVSDNGVLMAPEELIYSKIATPKGTLLNHVLNTDHEVHGNIAISKILLENGVNEIKLLPKVKESEPYLRERYYGKEYCGLFKTTTPDSLVDGSIVEFKEPSLSTLDLSAKKASKQANNILLKINQPFSNVQMERFIEKQWKNRLNLETIFIIRGNEVTKFVRP